jgi:hypothetical protein
VSLTRRRVLAALAAAGGAGAIAGQGTGALLRDSEGAGGGLTAGLVDLTVAYWQGDPASADLNDPDGVADGPRLALPVRIPDDGTEGRTLLRFSLPESARGVNNPASLWLRADCPRQTTLAELLGVRLRYSDADGTPGPLIDAGSLREVAEGLRTGRRLDGNGDPADGVDCLTDDLFVLVEYDLQGYVGSETVEFALDVAAIQCRNSDPDRNPFAPSAPEPCPPAWRCDCCWPVGKVEVDEPLEAGRTYAFDEGLVGYALDVTAVDGDSGVAFELVSTDGKPVLPLCAVEVKGGRGDSRYTRVDEDTYGTDTSVLEGAVEGVVSAPENPNSGGRYAISYVLVSVCAPALESGECPEPLAEPAASVDRARGPSTPESGGGSGRKSGPKNTGNGTDTTDGRDAASTAGSPPAESSETGGGE